MKMQPSVQREVGSDVGDASPGGVTLPHDIAPLVQDGFTSLQVMLCGVPEMVGFGAMSGFGVEDVCAYALTQHVDTAPEQIVDWMSAIGRHYDDIKPDAVVPALEAMACQLGWAPASALAFAGSSRAWATHLDRLGMDYHTMHRFLPHGQGVKMRGEVLDAKSDVFKLPAGMVVPTSFIMDDVSGLRVVKFNDVKVYGDVNLNALRDCTAIEGKMTVSGDVRIGNCPHLASQLHVDGAKSLELAELPAMTDVPDIHGSTQLMWSGQVGFWRGAESDTIKVADAFGDDAKMAALANRAAICDQSEAFAMGMSVALACYGNLHEDRATEEKQCEGLIAILTALHERFPWVPKSAIAMTSKDRNSYSLSGQPSHVARSRASIVSIGFKEAISKKDK